MNLASRVQILAEAVCLSHSANTLGKVMNSTILLPWVSIRADWALYPFCGNW